MTRNKVDVIIISDAKNLEVLEVTRKCLDSLIRSSITNTFNIVVIESQKDVFYEDCNSYKWDHKVKTHHPDEEFGYNKFLNIGIKMTSSPYIALCNSDLTFKKGWSEQIVSVMERYGDVYSASPFCPEVHGSNEKHFSQVYLGYEIRKEFCGWCIMQKRIIYDIIGLLDERFKFWYADNDLALTIQKHNLQHVLVPASVVHHHSNNIGKTAEALSEDEINNFTQGQYKIFKDKWGL